MVICAILGTISKTLEAAPKDIPGPQVARLPRTARQHLLRRPKGACLVTCTNITVNLRHQSTVMCALRIGAPSEKGALGTLWRIRKHVYKLMWLQHHRVVYL